MKKIIAAAAAATFVFAQIVSAASFTTDLQVGSANTDVTALQNFLITNGFHIPLVESGSAAKGLFGGQTKKAVQQYQASRHIPATGFVGPLTRAALNKDMSATTTVSVVNMTVSTSTPSPASQVALVQNQQNSTPGVPGTLSVSLQATPADGTQIAKGQTKDIAMYKLQSSASDMQMRSIQMDFGTRFWLYAGSITVKDDIGNIVAQKNNLSARDFTEITAGSDYQLNLPVSGYDIPPNTTRYLTGSVSMLSSSDRPSGNITISNLQVRATDGTGYTGTQTLQGARTIAYTGASNGTLVITIDPKSPPNMDMPISTAGPTLNLPLGVVDLTMQGASGTVRTLSMYFNTSVDRTTNITTVFKAFKIQIGTDVYTSDSVTYTPNGSVIVFNNLHTVLPQDTAIPMAIMVDINQDTNHMYDGIVASSSMLAIGTAGGASNNPVVEDSSFTPMAVSTTGLLSSDITFTARTGDISTMTPTATLGTPVINNNRTVAYNMSFSFPITAGNDTLYVSADPNIMLATSSTGFGSDASSSLPIAGVTSDPSNLAGDSNVTSSSGYYVIPAGSTRTFTFAGSMNGAGGTQGLKTFSITGVKYGTTTSALSANSIVYYNYAALKVAAWF